MNGLSQEERLVAELEKLGVRYLSRQSTEPGERVRNPAIFLADLIRQPSSRVRTAFIAVLLAQPGFARAVPDALDRLQPEEQLTLKLLYTAAVALQKKHAGSLQVYLGPSWQWLPDLYSTELGLETYLLPEETLVALGDAHRQQTGIVLNWTGTYENVAHHLLHRWELENQWNR
jgi:hypothetical protein